MNEGTDKYEFLAPPKIVFGWGRRSEVGALSREAGCKRAFIVSGSRRLMDDGVVAELSATLTHSGVKPIYLAEIRREPQVSDVDNAVAALAKHQATWGDWVVAIGGGSAIDLAKAVAAMATHCEVTLATDLRKRNFLRAHAKHPPGRSVRDYLDGVGSGLEIERPPLTFVAMPTTGGTGSEATKNAVISSHDPPFKKSLRSEKMIPRVVLVDPELSVNVPPKITAQTGMDAITQLIESYISRRAQPIPRALAVQGLQLALPAIVEAVENGSSRPAREAMAHAALLSGMALANSGLGMAHGVAAALGIVCDVPHGLACAVMLPAALRANREVARAELATLGRAVGQPAFAGDLSRASDEAAADAFVVRIDSLCQTIGVPRRLGEIGVRSEHIPALVAQSRGNSMSGNPRDLSDEELAKMLANML
jgi:alcohol dehydrogenase class IV